MELKEPVKGLLEKVKLLAGDYITITCNEGTLYIFRSSTSGASLKTERLQDQASSTSSRIYTQCRQFKRKNIFDEFSSVESPIRIIVCRTGTVFFEDTEQDGLQAEFGTMLDHKPFTQGTRCQFWPNPL